MDTDFQLIIIGGGPAGLTAGLYAARSRLKVILVEKGAVGGQVLTTDRIDNYPGFPEGISGFDLIDKMAAQADRFGLETKIAAVTSMDLSQPVKTIHFEDNSRLTCRSVILATGARPNTLGVPGEKELTGKGVSYCATCDGPFYRDQEVVVVGGGDTAVQEADHLTKFAGKVTVIHRRDTLRATKILQEKAQANSRIEFLWNTEVTAVKGGESGVERLSLRNNINGKESEIAVQGIFVLVGTIPNNEVLPLDQLETDSSGFVKTDQEMRTNLPGVMAVGDIRSKNVRQVVNATGEGATATLAAETYLHEQE